MSPSTSAILDDNPLATSELVSFESLIRLTRSMAKAGSQEKILSLAALSIMGKLAISRIAFLWKDENGEWKSTPQKRGPEEYRNGLISDTQKLLELRPEQEDEPFLLDNGRYLFFQPIDSNDGQAYLLVDSNKGMIAQNRGRLNKESLRYIELVMSIALSSLTIHDTKSALRTETNTAERQDLFLSNLFHISRDFASLFSEKEILRVFSYYLMGHLQVSRFAVLREGESPTVLLNRFSKIEDNKLLYYYTFVSEGERIEDKEIAVALNAEIRGEQQGAVLLGKKLSGKAFTEYELSYLRSLVNTTFTALENARLFDEQLKLEILEGELEIARNIQRGFLPVSLPEIPGYDAYGINLSAKHVGGDYYDVVKDKEGNFAVVMADVSGKGVPASLIMANLQSAVRLLVRMGFKLETIVEELNTLVCANTSADKFVTLCLSLLKPDKKLLKNCTAGHPPPIQLSLGTDRKFSVTNKRLLEKGGMVLGVVEGYKDYVAEYTDVHPGDVFVYYTDGFTDGDLGDRSGQDVFIETVVEALNLNLKGQELDLRAASKEVIERMSKIEGILPDDMTLFLLHKLA